MDEEHSAGAVVFYNDAKSGEFEFLILNYEEGHWDFPKGHIEAGEKPLDAMLREVKEETGLDVEPVYGFSEKIEYTFKAAYDGGRLKHKTVDFFLASAKTKRVTLSHEHMAFKWLPYSQVSRLVTYENSRKVLRAAYSFLKSVYDK